MKQEHAGTEREERADNDNRKQRTMAPNRSVAQNEQKKLGVRQRWSAAQPTKTVAFWLCVACVVLTMLVGFTWGGWVTGGTAQKTAQTLAKEAVIQRLAPICVAQFQQDPEKEQTLIALRETDSWQRSASVKDQAWTILPGEEAADSKVTDACVKLLLQVGQ